MKGFIQNSVKLLTLGYIVLHIVPVHNYVVTLTIVKVMYLLAPSNAFIVGNNHCVVDWKSNGATTLHHLEMSFAKKLFSSHIAYETSSSVIVLENHFFATQDMTISNIPFNFEAANVPVGVKECDFPVAEVVFLVPIICKTLNNKSHIRHA